ncbi:hypothetical protein BJX66DRAFT_309224 [Aspergillus keveii]|uniref:Secreted protein n=1 Tax=Aspergillus keveii TaxID=714993 RepID=A0ABR4FYC7_9EURO
MRRGCLRWRLAGRLLILADVVLYIRRCGVACRGHLYSRPRLGVSSRLSYRGCCAGRGAHLEGCRGVCSCGLGNLFRELLGS